MDSLPHFGLNEQDIFKRNSSAIFQKVLIVDVLLAAIALVAVPLFLQNSISPWLVFGSMFACMSPDLIWGWHFYHEIKYKKVRAKKWFSKFHRLIQWKQ